MGRCCLPSVLANTIDIAFSLIAKYKYKSSPRIGEESTRAEVKNFFRSSKVSWHCSVHWKLSGFLRILKNSEHLSPLFGTNFPSAATQPASLYTSLTELGDCISSIAFIFFRLASIPLLETMYLRNFLEEAPNTLF